jgi:hypothetical protein
MVARKSSGAEIVVTTLEPSAMRASAFSKASATASDAVALISTDEASPINGAAVGRDYDWRRCQASRSSCQTTKLNSGGPWSPASAMISRASGSARKASIPSRSQS